MKKMLIGCVSAFAMMLTLHTSVSAHETDNQGANANWSAEETHVEGVNSHLWIVNRAVEIMERNQSMIHPEELSSINLWRNEIEEGIYAADWENPYYDNYTFASHFYDPDSNNTYIPYAKNAKETGAKYFKLAGEAYQRGEMEVAFFNLGLSLHYFGDLTQPMHAANFTNLSHPVGFHSKYENFVDTIKDPYVSQKDGRWDFAGDDPEAWLHKAAVEAKAAFPTIVNDDTKWWFVRASISDHYAQIWRNEVTPATGDRLMEAQREMAGFIHLWFDTYVNE